LKTFEDIDDENANLLDDEEDYRKVVPPPLYEKLWKFRFE
jgi:hypothetical protein